MSECIIIDETSGQTDSCTEVTPRDIVDFVLEDILLSAYAILDKGCYQIGDFNVTENYCQPFNQNLPNFIKNEKSLQKSPNENLSPKLKSGENANESISFTTAKESIDLVLNNVIPKENVISSHECKVISEDILADNELQIQSGQIRLESNKPDEKPNSSNTSIYKYYRNENADVKDSPPNIYEFSSLNEIETETIEKHIEQDQAEGNHKKNENEDKTKTGIPFTPFTTETLRQSILQAWGNGKTSIIGGWDGDMSAQMEEITLLIQGLSSAQVISDTSIDPNRPRSCAFAEEDVKKIIKEIENINFNQAHCNSDEAETAYNTDGQGDADLESKSIHNKLPKTLKAGSKSEILNDDSKSLNKEKQQKSVILVNSNDQALESVLLCDQNEEDFLEEANLTRNNSPTLTSDISEVWRKKKEVNELLSSGKRSEISFETYGNEMTSFDSKNLSENTLDMFNSQYTIKAKNSPKKVINTTSNKDVKNELIEDLNFETHILESLSHSVSERVDETNENYSPTSRIEELNIFPSSKIPICSINKPTDFDQTNVKTDFEPERESFLKGNSNIIRNTKSTSDAYEDSLCSLIVPDEYCTSSEGHLKSKDNISVEEGHLTSKVLNKEKKFHKQEVSTLRSLSSLIKTNINYCNKKASQKNIEKPNANELNFATFKEGRNIVLEIMEFQKETLMKNENNHTLKEDKRTHFQEKNTRNENVKENNSNNSLDNLNTKESSEVQTDQPKQQFRLHSNKMYFGAELNLDHQEVNESVLTDAEEAYIETAENILQIIDPPDDSNDEGSNQISFSLLNERSSLQPTTVGYDSQATFSSSSLEEYEKREEINETRKKHSGMTAVGPLKNIDYDPKNLTSPNIDYGKMTHITSSKQLAKDIFGSELKIVPSVRIAQENEPNNEMPILGGNSHLETTSLVNRDIASLTKVQKVREVMSYYPKPEEDFQDDDSLPRTRLDLKDVESTTNERYKVPDVSIPLLSFEVSSTNTDVTSKYVQSPHLVLSASCFNDGEDLLEEGNQEICEQVAVRSLFEENCLKKKESKLQFQIRPEKRNEIVKPMSLNGSKHSHSTDINIFQKESREDIQKKDTANQFKYCTLSRVLQKASSKFIRKDSDVILRNSKSLPRENMKMSATESIKSFLSEHHSSATNALKKSRSLLRNTQNIFKSKSQNRFETQESFSKDKTSPIDSEESGARNLESKLPSFLKKEEFKRTKNLIKSKVEKTFKKFENENNESREHKIILEKDLRVVIRNEENYQIDRMENFRKFLPKSPMVYKSQFVKSQIGIQPDSSSFQEPCGTQTSVAKANPNELLMTKIKEIAVKKFDEGQSKREFDQSLIQDLSEEALEKEEKTWIAEVQNERDINLQNFSQDVGYVIMETIQGLPTTDLGSSLIETKTESKEMEEYPNKNKSRGEDLPQENMLESLNSQRATANNDDVKATPTSPQKNENKSPTKNLKEKKNTLKNKKLSARFRNFWCSAFGRVKTPPQKAEAYMKSQKNENDVN